MTTYTRADMKKLHVMYLEEVNKYNMEQHNKFMEKYNAHTDVIVKFITKIILYLAKYENKTEFTNPVALLDNKNEEAKANSLYIDIYDREQIDKVIEKLKETFLNFDYKFGYNKNGDFCITINWD